MGSEGEAQAMVQRKSKFSMLKECDLILAAFRSLIVDLVFAFQSLSRLAIGEQVSC